MKRSVFIVEDHAIMRDSLMQLLNMEEALTVCGAVETAEEAIDLIPEVTPDLALVDVSLPGMSGIELTKRLSALCPTLPILVVSGHDVSVYGEQAEQAGAVGYVVKAEGPVRVVEAVHAALASRL